LPPHRLDHHETGVCLLHDLLKEVLKGFACTLKQLEPQFDLVVVQGEFFFGHGPKQF
jgi:hypothetical protein